LRQCCCFPLTHGFPPSGDAGLSPRKSKHSSLHIVLLRGCEAFASLRSGTHPHPGPPLEGEGTRLPSASPALPTLPGVHTFTFARFFRMALLSFSSSCICATSSA
jgi:hypothetical protein